MDVPIAWTMMAVFGIVACGARTDILVASQDADVSDVLTEPCDSVSADFAASGLNPHGAWSYGWSSSLGDTFNTYTLFIAASATPSVDPNTAGLDVWSSINLTSAGGYLPSVFFNPSTVTLHPAGVYSVEPDQFGLHPGPTGEYSIARWVAMTSGAFAVTATFVGLHGYGGGKITTTDVHVLHDGSDIAKGDINIDGFGNTFSTSVVVNVLSGETIDFAVGVGDGTYDSDSTGLDAIVCKSR